MTSFLGEFVERYGFGRACARDCAAFNTGGLLSITALLLNFLSQKGRVAMKADFETTTYRNFEKI